jgi:hypothetical protein
MGIRKVYRRTHITQPVVYCINRIPERTGFFGLAKPVYQIPKKKTESGYQIRFFGK